MAGSGPTRWPLAPDRLERRLPDRKPPLAAWEAEAEASRCLYCHDAPCIRACPTAIDIPTFIRKIATGNLRGAARTILRANLLGLSCARVCPVEVLCEGACVYVGWQRPPIQIGRLQRHALERGGTSGVLAPTPASPASSMSPASPASSASPASPASSASSARRRRSVGLVGAGPASLACAGRLALAGCGATIYELAQLPGGLATAGIAPYKLWADDALAEIAFIESLGAEIRTGVEVGRDVTAGELLARHDTVFLGPGLGADRRLGVPGEDGPGVTGALDWIRRLKLAPAAGAAAAGAPAGARRAVVVGGGNTAVDAARELAALGVPAVTLVYRRRRARMKAYAHELALARQEGVVLVEEATVAEIVRRGGDGGAVSAVRLVAAGDDDGPRELPADLVVIAIGQAGPRELAAMFPGVACDERACIIVDPATGATGNPRVFAGGDAVNGGKEVVNAVHDGQLAAATMLARFAEEDRPDA